MDTRNRTSKKRRTAVACTVALVLTFVVTVVVTSGRINANGASGRVFQPGTLELPKSEPQGWSVSYPISLPRTYTVISGLYAESTHLWAVAAGTTQNSLLEYSAQTGRMVRDYRISDPPGANLGIWRFAPIALDLAGNVWVGVNASLVEINPQTREEHVVPLPSVPTAAKGSKEP